MRVHWDWGRSANSVAGSGDLPVCRCSMQQQMRQEELSGTFTLLSHSLPALEEGAGPAPSPINLLDALQRALTRPSHSAIPAQERP